MKRMEQGYNASAWGHVSILNYFDTKRLTTKDVYPSEWFFIKQKLKEGMSVLDVGCAKGGFANVLAEHLQVFSYVGVDINQDMITAAKNRFPHHQFYQVQENNYSILRANRYDLVLCLGILHLHESWRETIATAWLHSKQCLILDLRESYELSIEDKKISYFKMDFANPHKSTSKFVLPYNIINAADALRTIHEICSDAAKITHYGYSHPISELAVSPIQKIMANVYCIER